MATTHEDVKDALWALGVEVRHKRTSWLMRTLGVVLGLVGIDFRRFWTTIGPSVIYAPDHVNLDDLAPHHTVILHELVHIGQARRLPVLWQLSYILLPVPFGLAWFRWRWEREAYLIDIRKGRRSIEDVVTVLWSKYGWCWPRSWMRRWFLSRTAGDPR